MSRREIGLKKDYILPFYLLSEPNILYGVISVNEGVDWETMNGRGWRSWNWTKDSESNEINRKNEVLLTPQSPASGGAAWYTIYYWSNLGETICLRGWWTPAGPAWPLACEYITLHFIRRYKLISGDHIMAMEWICTYGIFGMAILNKS
jgi:hypothetical protein